MNTPVSNVSISGTLNALDISKKYHDAKIRYSDGRTSYLRIENTLRGFNRLNRPGFPGEYFVCELRLPEPGSRLMHNTLFPLQPGGYDRAAPSTCDCCTSPPRPA